MGISNVNEQSSAWGAAFRDKPILSDGKLTETIKADYFSTLPRIDRVVFYEKAHFNRGYGTFLSKPAGID
ncbi:MAG: hypothetical protein K2K74_12585 [Lachnospiraceae bacterium]|nr:hypothetical protein [Lachnospiraceae bacterium]